MTDTTKQKKRLTKPDLIARLRRLSGGNKAESEQALDYVTTVIKDGLEYGHTVSIPGFATFEVVDTPARQAQNPATGEVVHVMPGRRIKFKPTAELKRLLAGGGRK